MKKMIPLTIKESQSCHKQNTCCILKKEFSIYNKDKKYQKITVIMLLIILVI